VDIAASDFGMPGEYCLRAVEAAMPDGGIDECASWVFRSVRHCRIIISRRRSFGSVRQDAYAHLIVRRVVFPLLDASSTRSRKLVGQVGHRARASVLGIPADRVCNDDALIRKQEHLLASISIVLDHQGGACRSRL